MYRQINAYNTHIEVFPYEAGENSMIENFYSVYDPIFYKMNPVAYYIENNTLYLPRGTNLNLLEKQFNSSYTVIQKSDPVDKIKIKSKLEPKSRIQEEAVEFLCSEGRFVGGSGFSQFSLNLEPGDGKTIATILALCKKYKCKTIVILHQTKLKNQWKDEFLKASNIDESRICDLVGSSAMFAASQGLLDGDIYLVNHQTIHQFGTKYGWNNVKEFFKNIKVGLKIYDEAHKYFSNILMIDFFSNTRHTFYLTATFTRTQTKEKQIFRRAFANTYRFGEETSNYEEKRKHTIYYYVKYNSHPNPMIIPKMYNKYSISSFKYIDYGLLYDENNTMLKALGIIMDLVKSLRGKILITSPKIESTEIIAKWLKKEYPYKTISVINSSKSDEENREAVHADIISSTVKSLGTGIDIRGLRVLINFEPFTSDSNMIQLKGRLREFSPEDNTFMFDLVDIGFSDIERMGEKRKAVMKRHALEIKDVNL